MVMDINSYDESFYEIIRDGCIRSANIVAPIIYDYFKPKKVIDIGCGEGHWAKAFENMGCEVLGVDGDYVQKPFVPFVAHDLNTPLPDNLGKFDLAVSFEVAEHLRLTSADRFVKQLTELAPVVAFSAAIPGQGGTGHINEQWPNFWIELFNKYDYEVSGALRWQIWENGLVENWYRQNLLIAVKGDFKNKPKQLFDSELTYPYPVVHPVLWNSRLK